MLYSIGKSILRSAMPSLALKRELERLLLEPVALDTRSKGIGLAGITAWHEWAHKADREWRGAVREFERCRGLLLRLFRHEIERNYQCDIQDIEALGSSKSDLLGVNTLDEFAERSAAWAIEHGKSGIQEFAKCGEIRILNQPDTSDCLLWHSWDKRFVLSNAGGSHRTAALRYLCRVHQQPLTINGELHRYILVDGVAQTLASGFALLVMPTCPIQRSELHSLLTQFDVPFGLYPSPVSYDGRRLLVLSKSGGLSAIAIETLRTRGLDDLCDVIVTLS